MHRKTSDHVIWSYCNNNRLHTEIWHQGRNEGPSVSCLCLGFYFTHRTSRAGIFPGLYVITHNEPIFRCVMTAASASVWQRVGKWQFKNNYGRWLKWDEVLSLTAFNDFGDCYQKYDRGEIEGTSSQCHTHTTAAFLYTETPLWSYSTFIATSEGRKQAEPFGPPVPCLCLTYNSEAEWKCNKANFNRQRVRG